MNVFYLVSRFPVGFSGREYILKQNIKTMVDKGISITIAYYDYGYSDGENSNHHLKSDYIKLCHLKK